MHIVPASPRLEPQPAPRVRLWTRARRGVAPTFHFWMETEVHVFAFSVAANVLLSFFPFLIVMLSLFRYVFHWHAAVDAIYLGLNDYFPDEFGSFIRRNLTHVVESRGPAQVASVALLLFTANGVFEPMEVALNRIWGIAKNRSYFRNQLISLGMIFACGALGLLSTTLTAFNEERLRKFAGLSHETVAIFSVIIFKVCAVPLVMLTLFLIYWLLPNARIPARSVAWTAICVGLMLEGLKWVNLLTWPWLRVRLAHEYGPFLYSATIVLWAFFAALLILAGAEWTSRHRPPDITIQ